MVMSRLLKPTNTNTGDQGRSRSTSPPALPTRSEITSVDDDSRERSSRCDPQIKKRKRPTAQSYKKFLLARAYGESSRDVAADSGKSSLLDGSMTAKMTGHTSNEVLKLNLNLCITCRAPRPHLYCKGKGCNRNYHLPCVNPPLKEVPFGIWYCPFCIKKRIELGEQSVSGGIESILGVKVDVENIKHYLVKYKELAYIHSRWIPESEMHMEAQDLVNQYDITPMGKILRFNPNWMKPERLLAKRTLVCPNSTDKLKSEHVKDYASCSSEWLVKWKDLGYEQATWELENSPFLCSDEGRALKEDYLQRRKKAIATMDPSKGEMALVPKDGKLNKLSRLPDDFPAELDVGHLSCINELLEFCDMKKISVLPSDQERILKTTALIKCLQPYSCRPVLVLSTKKSLSLWGIELARLAPSISTIIYDGDEEVRKMIRAVDFYEEKGGCLMFQVLLSHPDAILEDLNILRCIGWEAVIFDECQDPKMLNNLENFSVLSSNFRLLVLTGTLKDEIDYLNMLFFLDPEGVRDVHISQCHLVKEASDDEELEEGEIRDDYTSFTMPNALYKKDNSKDFVRACEKDAAILDNKELEECEIREHDNGLIFYEQTMVGKECDLSLTVTQRIKIGLLKKEIFEKTLEIIQNVYFRRLTKLVERQNQEVLKFKSHKQQERADLKERYIGLFDENAFQRHFKYERNKLRRLHIIARVKEKILMCQWTKEAKAGTLGITFSGLPLPETEFKMGNFVVGKSYVNDCDTSYSDLSAIWSHLLNQKEAIELNSKSTRTNVLSCSGKEEEMPMRAKALPSQSYLDNLAECLEMQEIKDTTTHIDQHDKIHNVHMISEASSSQSNSTTQIATSGYAITSSKTNEKLGMPNRSCWHQMVELEPELDALERQLVQHSKNKLSRSLLDVAQKNDRKQKDVADAFKPSTTKSKEVTAMYQGEFTGTPKNLIKVPWSESANRQVLSAPCKSSPVVAKLRHPPNRSNFPSEELRRPSTESVDANCEPATSSGPAVIPLTSFGHHSAAATSSVLIRTSIIPCSLPPHLRPCKDRIKAIHPHKEE